MVTGPVGGYVVFLSKGVEEMVDMGFVKVFNPKVINCKGEDEAGSFVAP